MLTLVNADYYREQAMKEMRKHGIRKPRFHKDWRKMTTEEMVYKGTVDRIAMVMSEELYNPNNFQAYLHL